MSNKNGPSITRTNLIGRTIFVTSEKHCPTNHRPQTKFFTCEKNSIGFPAFQEGFPSQWWMNKTRSFVVPFKSWLLDKAVQALQIFLHGRNSSKAKKTKTHTPKQSSTECRFAEWSTSIPLTLFVRIFIIIASLFAGAVIHGRQFSISINSLSLIDNLDNSRNWGEPSQKR